MSEGAGIEQLRREVEFAVAEAHAAAQSVAVLVSSCIWTGRTEIGDQLRHLAQLWQCAYEREQQARAALDAAHAAASDAEAAGVPCEGGGA